MKYVKLGNNNVSRLGFGCMRFPEKNGSIDYDETLKMARYAIENGVNYFDTAYIYHGGESEIVVRKIAEEFGRDKIFIADKLPMWNVKVEDDFQRLLDEQLDRLGTDYIDYYLFHCLNNKFFELMKKYNYKDFIKRNIENGKIKHIGFSFHDGLSVFKDIIDDYNWDFCQIQFNYLDTEYQAGLEGYEYATNRGIPVIVMEPIRGGTLASIPTSMRNIFSSDLSDAEIALKYVANFENNKVILSGMSAIEHAEINVKLFSSDLVNSLTDEEKAKYKKARTAYYNYKLIDCTACDYCVDACPHQIPISTIFAKYNSDIENPNMSNAKEYNTLPNASQCTKCGNCEASCPQELDISDKLQVVHEHFND